MCGAVGKSTHLGTGLAFLGVTPALLDSGFLCDSDGSWTSVLISATTSLGIKDDAHTAPATLVSKKSVAAAVTCAWIMNFLYGLISEVTLALFLYIRNFA